MEVNLFHSLFIHLSFYYNNKNELFYSLVKSGISFSNFSKSLLYRYEKSRELCGLKEISPRRQQNEKTLTKEFYNMFRKYSPAYSIDRNFEERENFMGKFLYNGLFALR